jgi:hypothetical protein
MQYAEPQTWLGYLHLINAKHPEDRQHHGKATWQRFQALALEAVKLQPAKMPSLQQAQ